MWEIKDATDPSVSGIAITITTTITITKLPLGYSEASFRSLSLGSFSWTIHNDIGCSIDPLNTTLTLTR